MDTTYLHSFVLVVEEGSMSQAARRLDLTPAAIAQQMRVLERTLDAQLLQRAGRTVKPTLAGQRLYKNALPLLRDIESLKQVVNTNPFEGELRLGAINTALLSFLPGTLKILSDDYPNLHVTIRSGHSSELINLLELQIIDAAICIHPNFAFAKSFRWQSLRHESLIMLTPMNTSATSPSELLQHYPLIRYDRQLAGGKQADQYLRQHVPFKPIESVELSNIMAIGLMVEVGLGVSIVPDINSRLLTYQQIRRIPLQTSAELRDIGILSLQHAFNKPVLDQLVCCFHRLHNKSP